MTSAFRARVLLYLHAGLTYNDAIARADRDLRAPFTKLR